MRTIVDIPPADIRRLDRLAKSQRVSRTKLVRQAVAEFTARNCEAPDVFGLWRDRNIDGVEYQRGLRAEWDREWDR